MKKNMKCMGVLAALAIVGWGAVPAGADDNPAPLWTFASSFDEVLILGENFESLNVGDVFSVGSLSEKVLDGTTYLVNNDKSDLNGNHFDGDSRQGWHTSFTFDDSPADHGAPSTGSYYIEGTADNLGYQFGIGVWNLARNTQYSITWSDPDVQAD